MRSSADILAFASQKGGSGKTTLSGHIAVQAQMAGAGPVAIIDTDPQQSLAQWRQARSDNGLIMKVSDTENIESDIDQLLELGVRLIVIDTPPAATSAIGDIVRHASLVCIPARPSPHDLRAVGSTVEIVEAHRKPMVFVLNSASVKAKITAEAAMSLSQHGTVAPTFIHNRVDFAGSMTDGRTAMEVSEGSQSAQEIASLWQYLSQRLDKVAQLDETDKTEAAFHEQQVGASEAAKPLRLDSRRSPTNSSKPSPSSVQGAKPVGKPGKSNRSGTLTARQFFGQRQLVKTATFIGPDRRREDKGSPTGKERRLSFRSFLSLRAG